MVIEVEEDEVGALARLERADLVVPAECAGTVDRRHAQRLPGPDLVLVQPGVLEKPGRQMELPHQAQIARGGDAVGAQPDRDAGRAHLRITADRGRPLGELEGRRRAERDFGVVLGQQRHLLVFHGNAVRDDEVGPEAVETGDAADRPRAVAALRHPGLLDRGSEMVRRADAEPLRQPARADVQLGATRFLALDVDPAANAPARVAVPVAHLLLEHLERDARVREEVVIDHLVRPPGRKHVGLDVGGMAADDAADPGLVSGPGRDAGVVLRAHVEEARRPAAEHLGDAELDRDTFVLGPDVRVERLRPVEDPRTRAQVVRKHSPREGLREVDMRVDEAGHCATASAVHDVIHALRRVRGEQLGRRPDRSDAAILHEDRGAAQNRVCRVDREHELEVPDQDARHAATASPPTGNAFVSQ